MYEFVEDPWWYKLDLLLRLIIAWLYQDLALFTSVFVVPSCAIALRRSLHAIA
ncbi:hypothetical protein [Fischerella sp. JS2]|uniref:hypothetical protein n=1 Tax=Fischerella sp. JS2 TaxID=2597771 RepID=UPI0028E52DC7|nr:hypothetical protein [Fischerella sp. JS2]